MYQLSICKRDEKLKVLVCYHHYQVIGDNVILKYYGKVTNFVRNKIRPCKTVNLSDKAN